MNSWICSTPKLSLETWSCGSPRACWALLSPVPAIMRYLMVTSTWALVKNRLIVRNSWARGKRAASHVNMNQHSKFYLKLRPKQPFNDQTRSSLTVAETSKNKPCTSFAWRDETPTSSSSRRGRMRRLGSPESVKSLNLPPLLEPTLPSQLPKISKIWIWRSRQKTTL